MRFCREGALAELWQRWGLGDVEHGALEVEAAYENFGDFWAPFPTGLAPSGACCASLEPARQEELRAACRRRLGNPAGPFTLSARAWFAVGRAYAAAAALRVSTRSRSAPVPISVTPTASSCSTNSTYLRAAGGRSSISSTSSSDSSQPGSVS